MPDNLPREAVWGRQQREANMRRAQLANLTMSTVKSGYELERTLSIDLFRLGQRGNYPTDQRIFDFVRNTLRLVPEDLSRLHHIRSEGAVWLKFKEEHKLEEIEARLERGVQFPGTTAFVNGRRLDQPTAVIRLEKLPEWVSKEDVETLCSKWGQVVSSERGMSHCWQNHPIWDGTWRVKVKRDWNVPVVHEFVLAEGSHWIVRDEGLKPPMSCNRCGSTEHKAFACTAKIRQTDIVAYRDQGVEENMVLFFPTRPRGQEETEEAFEERKRRNAEKNNSELDTAGENLQQVGALQDENSRLLLKLARLQKEMAEQQTEQQAAMVLVDESHDLSKEVKKLQEEKETLQEEVTAVNLEKTHLEAERKSASELHEQERTKNAKLREQVRQLKVRLEEEEMMSEGGDERQQVDDFVAPTQSVDQEMPSDEETEERAAKSPRLSEEAPRLSTVVVATDGGERGQVVSNSQEAGTSVARQQTEWEKIAAGVSSKPRVSRVTGKEKGKAPAKDGQETPLPDSDPGEGDNLIIVG